MSVQDLDPKLLKRKRQLTGNSEKGEGSGGQDPGDVEIGQSSAPEHGGPSQGQELDATRKTLFSLDILTLLLQTKSDRIGSRLHPPRPS